MQRCWILERRPIPADHAALRAAVEALIGLAPGFEDDANVRDFVTRWYWSPELIESLLEGVARARGATGVSMPAPPVPSSGAGSTPAVDLSLAVLPFTARTGDASALSLADALTDDITTGLSRFEHLSILSRAAAAAMGTASNAVAAGCRYVLDGTVRTSGNAVRVGVRIADTRTSATVWAANLDADGDSGVFALQDDLASRIVATVGDPTGVLAKAMRAALAGVPLEHLGAEALMVLYHGYTEQFQPEEHARLRDALERFVEREPHVGSGMGGRRWALPARVFPPFESAP